MRLKKIYVILVKKTVYAKIMGYYKLDYNSGEIFASPSPVENFPFVSYSPVNIGRSTVLKETRDIPLGQGFESMVRKSRVSKCRV